MQDMEPGPYKAGCDGYMSDFMVYKVAMSGREEHSVQVWRVPIEMLFGSHLQGFSPDQSFDR